LLLLRAVCHSAPVFETATAVVVFLFGLAIGSFLNVCIHRIPRVATDARTGLLRTCFLQLAAITAPPSACPGCGARIKPYDNIPVLSYALLRGRCRSCRAPISFVYPLVELLTGFLFLASYYFFGITPVGAKWAFFSSLIVVLIFTDIFRRMLPDLINLGGFLAGLAFSVVVPVGDGTALWLSHRLSSFPMPALVSLLDALVGAALGSGLLWLVGEAYFRLRGREGMGLGDVKMMAMVGTFLGTKLALMTIFIGSLSGSVIGMALILGLHAAGWKRDVAMRAARRHLGSERALRWALAQRYQLPFGVFLGIGALIAAFWGDSITAWYSSLFRV
jgi:leader peptidase (prepilin peptidase)/N-methyltransferase